MSYAVVTTKVDPQTKKKAQQTADELGLPLSVVIKAFLKQFIRSRSITFSIAEKPSEYLLSVVNQARKDRKQNKASPVFDSGKKAVAWLEKQGV